MLAKSLSGSDLVLDKNCKIKSKGEKVKLIQEWLCLHGIHVSIDSDFGPATDYAVKQFQKSKGLKEDGVVGKNTFAALILPMTSALSHISPDKKSLNQMIIAYAKQHLRQHPREIGGQNKGPWVRLYMAGYEGPQWPWCAGFASFILKSACQSLNIPLPVSASFSCDILAAGAKGKNIFLAESNVKDKRLIKSGSLFLSRRTASDWNHTGIIIQAEDQVLHTIEGNTNDEGSREGYEVCRRIRSYRSKDFILI